MVIFCIKNNLPQHEIQFLLRTWAKNVGVEVLFAPDSVEGISVGQTADSRIQTSGNFSPDYFRHIKLNAQCLVENQDGKPDYLATAFYMLNCIQEFNDPDPDELGRFRFSNSYQHLYKNAAENIVQGCFNEISTICEIPSPTEKTKFFLTHDIDSVYGAILEDGFNVIKKGRIDLFLRMLFNIAIQKPDWLNMDKIMSIESEYDCKSVFYWIVNQGRINKREVNADYSFHSSTIQKNLKAVKESGFENGIHKSISVDSLSDEIKKFGTLPIGNRYHYLKFHLPEMYHQVESSGIKVDASVGFAEEMGFRNSYGLPFNPFDFNSMKPFSFVEAPLHIMDRTFFQYKKSNPRDAEKDILNFFERNKENCVLSILWHNNFFTDYKFKGYLDLYKKLLSYIKDNNYKAISQDEIIQKYSIV
ncbi:MAG TPA: hypothetical protein PLJ60_17985 [Chryseolinea sp.]|nr:hypothetical protein [Chryseolinea sp.]